jgi:hypothetical protein
MRSDNAQIYHAVCYLAADPSAARIFHAVADKIGVTGWEVARSSTQRLEETEKILGTLLQINALRAHGCGLDAYYAPSREAYLFKHLV